MSSLVSIQHDIAALPPDAQQVIFDLVEALKLRYCPPENSLLSSDWSDFIGCGEAETDLSRNYKTYLNQDLDAKHTHY